MKTIRVYHLASFVCVFVCLLLFLATFDMQWPIFQFLFYFFLSERFEKNFVVVVVVVVFVVVVVVGGGGGGGVVLCAQHKQRI